MCREDIRNSTQSYMSETFRMSRGDEMNFDESLSACGGNLSSLSTVFNLGCSPNCVM